MIVQGERLMEKMVYLCCALEMNYYRGVASKPLLFRNSSFFLLRQLLKLFFPFNLCSVN